MTQEQSTPVRNESAIILIALVGAGFGATAVLGSVAGALAGKLFGLARASALVGAGLGAIAGIVLGILVASRITGTSRKGSRFWIAVAGGQAGLVLAAFLAVYADAFFRVFQIVLILVPGVCAAIADRLAANRA